MTDLTPLFPREPVPPLSLPLVGGGTWSLESHGGSAFTMLVFYRGLHCPICKTYLGSLEKQLGAFAERGVTAVAISSDGEDRAARAKAEWGLERLPVGYGLTLETARRWGLYVSTSRGTTSTGIEEPALFSEPALYLVKPDGTLYFGTVQTMPFARPRFEDILPALDFVIAKGYPARGEVKALPAEAAA